VKASGADPIFHFLRQGWKEGRDPSPAFKLAYYLELNPDVRQAGINPLIHYIRFGMKEGRPITNPDLYNRFLGIQVAREHDRPFTDLMALMNPDTRYPRAAFDQPVDILIPVYNGVHHLRRLLDSLSANTTTPHRLLITDDGSPDPQIQETLQGFKVEHPNLDITLLRNEHNIGYLKTVNLMAGMTRNHFVILNTDTEVPPGWLERLLFPIYQDESVASTTPFTNSGTICSFPDFNQDNGLFEGLEVAQIDHFFQMVDYKKNLVEIPTAIGFCMGVNRAVYQKIGMFLETFGRGYGEENDWCMRASAEGYRHVIVPNLYVYHAHGGSFSVEEKEKLLESNLQKMRAMHPEYDQKVDAFIHTDPLHDLRNLLVAKILSSIESPPMIINHSFGGGASEFLRLKFQDSKLVLIVNNLDSAGNYRLIIHAGGREAESYRLSDLHQIEEVMTFFGVSGLCINELVSYPRVLDTIEYLTTLKKNNKQVKHEFYAHDYFAICPSFNLLNDQVKFCGVPDDLRICDACLKRNPHASDFYGDVQRDYPDLRMQTWREAFSSLLTSCDRVTCFSNSSRNLFVKAYPEISNLIRVIPHRVDWVRKAIVIHSKTGRNIAVLGNITFQKGAEILIKLASYLDESNSPHQLHIFGLTDEPYNTRMDTFKSVRKHNAYRKADLPVLMEDYQVDMVLIPSIWPETFSYTTEEAIKMDLPVAVFDLGAPAERVRNYAKGLILDRAEPEFLVDMITGFLDKLIDGQESKS
jgi:GT2 family glycosyltransferase/glycosyltransferase involved in cell wall biosynthesis